MTEELERDEWLATWEVYPADLLYGDFDFHDDEILDGTCRDCFGEYGDGWSNCTCYDDYNLSYYEEPRGPYPFSLPGRLSLALDDLRRFLRRGWARCPDCGQLEWIAWRWVGEHWDCIPF